MSDALIERLSAGLERVPRLQVVRRLCIGVVGGAAVSALLTVWTLGLRPDMAQAVGEGMFWVKLAYAVALCGVAVWACERLARPAGRAGGRWPWLLAPMLLLAAFAAWEFARAPAPMRGPMLMGHSHRICPWLILIFSAPPLAALIWAVRGLAPTRLRLTGAMLGLAAGGAGAAAYALHCDESAAPFLMVWYTLGVALAGGLGGVLGPRLLKW